MPISPELWIVVKDTRDKCVVLADKTRLLRVFMERVCMHNDPDDPLNIDGGDAEIIQAYWQLYTDAKQEVIDALGDAP